MRAWSLKTPGTLNRDKYSAMKHVRQLVLVNLLCLETFLKVRTLEKELGALIFCIVDQKYQEAPNKKSV
jgi:hypothetical protein